VIATALRRRDVLSFFDALPPARMSAALVGNPSVISRSRSGLSDARIEAEVADELLRLLEA
jgi:hypothetical protein